jgi:hypothetical protein
VESAAAAVPAAAAVVPAAAVAKAVADSGQGIKFSPGFARGFFLTGLQNPGWSSADFARDLGERLRT